LDDDDGDEIYIDDLPCLEEVAVPCEPPEPGDGIYIDDLPCLEDLAIPYEPPEPDHEEPGPNGDISIDSLPEL
jgi:hypothetical protein